MATCDTCGNDSQSTFTVNWDDRTATFDSIECAAMQVAPQCPHCGTRILGHGVAEGDTVYCCAHCAPHSTAAGAHSASTGG